MHRPAALGGRLGHFSHGREWPGGRSCAWTRGRAGGTCSCPTADGGRSCDAIRKDRPCFQRRTKTPYDAGWNDHSGGSSWPLAACCSVQRSPRPPSRPPSRKRPPGRVARSASSSPSHRAAQPIFSPGSLPRTLVISGARPSSSRTAAALAAMSARSSSPAPRLTDTRPSSPARPSQATSACRATRATGRRSSCPPSPLRVRRACSSCAPTGRSAR